MAWIRVTETFRFRPNQGTCIVYKPGTYNLPTAAATLAVAAGKAVRMTKARKDEEPVEWRLNEKGAGSLSERVAFLEPDEIPDGYGGHTTGYVERFQEPARMQPRMGSETVIASRLAGIQPYTMTVRSSAATRAVTPAWRVRNVRSGKTYNIKAAVNIDERNAYLEMLVVEGEAG